MGGVAAQELCDPETASCIVLQNQNMYERLGGEEREWVELQAAKALEDEERGRIATALPAFPVRPASPLLCFFQTSSSTTFSSSTPTRHR